MRVRETSVGSLTAETHTVKNGYGTVLYTTKTGKTFHKRIEDVETPNFHARKKCGEFLPLNPVRIVTLTEERVPGEVLVTSTHLPEVNYREGKYWETATWPFGFAPHDEQLRDQAILNASKKASTGQWDVLTTLAEMRETVQTVKTLAGRFRDSATKLARFARRSRRNPWDEFRRLWLEGRYGIRPIVYDIDAAFTVLSSLRDQASRVIGRSSLDINPDVESDTGWLSYSGVLDVRRRHTRVSHVKHLGWASCSLEFGVNSRLQVQPLVTAWELVPFSFVVDKFIDLGGWVSTLQPRLTGSFEGASTSLKFVEQLTQVIEYRSKSPHSGGWGSIMTIKTREEYIRAPTSVPLPPFLPGRLNLWDVIDLAALFLGTKREVVNTLNNRRYR